MDIATSPIKSNRHSRMGMRLQPDTPDIFSPMDGFDNDVATSPIKSRRDFGSSFLGDDDAGGGSMGGFLGEDITDEFTSHK